MHMAAIDGQAASLMRLLWARSGAVLVVKISVRRRGSMFHSSTPLYVCSLATGMGGSQI
jgi:hypothetical protein